MITQKSKEIFADMIKVTNTKPVPGASITIAEYMERTSYDKRDVVNAIADLINQNYVNRQYGDNIISGLLLNQPAIDLL